MRLAIIGYGNIGRAAEAAARMSGDIELVGVFHHDDNLDAISADVVILSTPTREVQGYAEYFLRRGISTVDSFDIHNQIYDLRQELKPIAKANNSVSIIASGWDPGTDSVIRCLMQAMVPNDGISYTNFGPGRSMGHSVVAKSKAGVLDALSITMPLGKGVHGRHVYVELEDGVDFEIVKRAILEDDYFAHDATVVEHVPCVASLNTTKHGVNLVRTGSSGVTANQQLEWNMRIDNPSLTGQILVCAARAAMRMSPGAYVLPEIPPLYMLEGDEEKLIRSLV